MLCSSISGLFTDRIWNFLSSIYGGFFISGTDSIIFIGQNWDGRGTIEYKGTNDQGVTAGGYAPSLHDAWENYYWLYDVNDIKRGYDGDVNPWDIEPYDHGTFPKYTFMSNELPNLEIRKKLVKGVAFDSSNDHLYLSVQNGGDSISPGRDVIVRLDASFSQSPPLITLQPENKTVKEGAEYTFRVVAQNVSSYQWYRNESPIAGATSNRYSSTAEADNDQDEFYVRVTSPEGGSLNSDTGVLTVSILGPDFRIPDYKFGDSLFSFDISGFPVCQLVLGYQ
jgi:hypothetical protein